MRPLIAFLALSLTALAQSHNASAQRMSSGSAPSTSHSHAHMEMTELQPPRPGDRERAETVAAEARKALEHYRDYRVALREGFEVFMPNFRQRMYHFTNWTWADEAQSRFNPAHPTSLLYVKTADGYRLIGAMYTAPVRSSLQDLDRRIPLSVAQWHLHTNMCAEPNSGDQPYLSRDARFGLTGSITTKADCEAAGGRFVRRVFGWMVHVYPFETRTEDVWNTERRMLD